MSISVNRVTIVGRMGADPEEPSNDKAPLSISLATSESWKDKSTGAKKEKTEWHRIKIWNDHSKKFLLDYAKKGDMVYIEGQLETSSYEKDGVTMYSTAVVVKLFGGVVQLQSKDSGGSRQPGEDREESYGRGAGEEMRSERTGRVPSSRPGASRPGQAPAFESGGMDDDIPF